MENMKAISSPFDQTAKTPSVHSMPCRSLASSKLPNISKQLHQILPSTMHDTEQGDNGEYLRFLDPGCQSGSKCLRRRIADLDYLDLQISADNSSCHDHVMFGSVACASPPRTAPRAIVYEGSPLPFCHDTGYLTSQRGLQAAAEARHALTELIQKMSESSYELSFNVFVKEEQSIEESQKVAMEEKQEWKSEGRIEKKNKNVSLGSRKKPKGRCVNPPRVQLRKESEKPAKKEWWKMLCSEISEVSNSTCSPNSSSSSSWLSETISIPGKEYFSNRKFRGCLF